MDDNYEKTFGNQQERNQQEQQGDVFHSNDLDDLSFQHPMVQEEPDSDDDNHSTILMPMMAG